jgi:hypothetical protein
MVELARTDDHGDRTYTMEILLDMVRMARIMVVIEPLDAKGGRMGTWS